MPEGQTLNDDLLSKLQKLKEECPDCQFGTYQSRQCSLEVDDDGPRNHCESVGVIYRQCPGESGPTEVFRTTAEENSQPSEEQLAPPRSSPFFFRVIRDDFVPGNENSTEDSMHESAVDLSKYRRFERQRQDEVFNAFFDTTFGFFDGVRQRAEQEMKRMQKLRNWWQTRRQQPGDEDEDEDADTP